MSSEMATQMTSAMSHHFDAVSSCFFLVDTYTCPILKPLVPLFWISGDASSGFHCQSGFCLIHFLQCTFPMS